MAKKYTRSQLDKLNLDKEFQRRVGDDKILKALVETPKRTRDDRITEMALALGGTASLGDYSIPAPTAGTLMLLGVLESPLLDPEKSPRLIDVDIALWIFVNGLSGLKGVGGMDDIERVAGGLCVKAGVSVPDVWKLMKNMVNESFTALERIPADNIPKEKEKCRFDLGWFTTLSSRVAEAANISADRAGWKMPLALASHYLVALHRKNGGKVFEPNKSAEAMKRLNELMDERIAEMNYK